MGGALRGLEVDQEKGHDHGPRQGWIVDHARIFCPGEDGKFFKSSDVGQADEAPEEAAVPVAEIGEILEPVRKRVTGKSKLRELGLSYEAVEAQRQTGLELLQEEVKIHEKENELDPEAVIFIKMLTGQVEELSKDLQEEAKVEEQQNLQMIEKVGEEHNVFLQTRMYSLAEVRENLEEWIPCMESEFKSQGDHSRWSRELEEGCPGKEHPVWENTREGHLLS